jgi:hypothetical protein
MTPCKHLDYESEYVQCEIRDLAPHYPSVRFWWRNKPPYPGAPQQVQFCRLHGRINGIFDCYEDGPFGCHES